MAGPGPAGLNPSTGPWRAPATTVARPRPELQPTRSWLFDGGPLWPPGEAAPAGVTVTAPTSVGLSGNSTSVTTPSFTPTANSKLIVIAAAFNNSHTTAKSWTVTGGGLGWTATSTSADFETGFGANFDFGSTIWWADVGSSPASMTVTADPYADGSLGFISIIVFEVIGLPSGGSFVVQAAVTNVTAGGSNTTALAAAPTAGNPVLAGWFSIAAAASTWNSPASGWTSLTTAAGDLISPNGLVSTTDADGSLAHGYTGSPVSCAGVLIEIGTPGPAAAASRQPLVATADTRRRRSTISTSRNPAPPAATPATATPRPLVVVGQVVRRRAEAIVTRNPQAPAAAPPAATPDAVVVARPPRRRLASIILGRARPTAPGTDPLVVSRRPASARGRIILARTPAAPAAAPATATPQPTVIGRRPTARARALIALVRNPDRVTPIATPDPVIVGRPGPRRRSFIAVARSADRATPISTPAPVVAGRRQRRPLARIVVARTPAAPAATPATATPRPLVIAGRALRRRAIVAITRNPQAPTVAPAVATPRPTVVSSRPPRRRLAVFLGRSPAKAAPVATPQPVVVTRRPRGRTVAPQLLRSPARASTSPRPLIVSRRPGPRFRLPIITRAPQAPARTPAPDPLVISRRPATRARRPIIGANPAKGPFFPKAKGPVVVTRNPVGRFRAFIRLAAGRRSTFTPSLDVPNIAVAATRHAAIAHVEFTDTGTKHEARADDRHTAQAITTSHRVTVTIWSISTASGGAPPPAASNLQTTSGEYLQTSAGAELGIT